MQPLNLLIKDFCGHSLTEFSFNDFLSALIIGKVKNNSRFSNGAGKSTIFNAIEYVLFNEIHFSALEKIIRDDCDVCKVEFDFISSLDKCIYRIVRSNSRKSGTDVRLFKKNNNNWEDLTQRRVSDTEKEIIKIVGFNYKSFCASMLFCQPGAENNIQKDFGNLPALTPEKRKSVLREILQLNIYSNYEKLAKLKYSNFQTELEKNKIILSTINDPDSALLSLDKELNDFRSILIELEDKWKLTVDNLSASNVEYNILSDKLSNLNNKINNLISSKNHRQEQIDNILKTIQNINFKIKSLSKEETKLKLNSYKSKVKNFPSEAPSHTTIKNELDKVIYNIINNNNLIKNISIKIKELQVPITNDPSCSHCHQVVSEEHKHSWHIKSQQEIIKYEREKQLLEKTVKNFTLNKIQIEKSLNESISKEKIFNDCNTNIILLEKELEHKETLDINYRSLLNEHNKSLSNEQQELEKINKELEKNTNIDTNKIDSQKIQELNKLVSSLTIEEKSITTQINVVVGKQAITKHKIEECKLNKQQKINISLKIKELEQSLFLHSKVIQAFGSNGIPSLITHSILDDLQNESNRWLLKLRPGLQLQFIVINDKNNKEKEDTLDISYFIDGKQREYKQLSGAQKIIVSLSIKLAILFIMNKRLGIDIKLMLLDEVDMALDPGSTEIFSEIIKIIQNEIKILVITHDDELKHKFSHAIIVEQDENNVSKGKLINW